VFALAVVLFACQMKKFPVLNYDRVIDTPEYQDFCNNNQTYTFPSEPKVSDEFKHLFTQMFLEDPTQRISLVGIASHPWVTREELPSTDELKLEILRLGKVRQGEINQWVMIEPESYTFLGNGLALRSMKDILFDVGKDYTELEN
jgi:serine/threonine protein kinase